MINELLPSNLFVEAENPPEGSKIRICFEYQTQPFCVPKFNEASKKGSCDQSGNCCLVHNRQGQGQGEEEERWR